MDRVTELEQENARLRAELEQERIFYAQLKESSTAKISQQRSFVLNEVRGRIEHELVKLERCLDGKGDENSQVGLEIIQDIKDRLSA